MSIETQGYMEIKPEPFEKNKISRKDFIALEKFLKGCYLKDEILGNYEIIEEPITGGY